MIDLQQLVILASFSAVLVPLAGRSFPDNPSTRRLFIVLASANLLVLPLLLTLLALPAFSWQLPLSPQAHGKLQQFHEPIADWVAFGAAAIALLLCARVLLNTWRERRDLRTLPQIHDGALQQQIDRQRHALKLSAPIRVCLGAGPCVSGGATPTLVLPQHWRSWSANTLTAVLTHELVHLRRRDDLLLVFQSLVTACLWWLPWLRGLQQRLDEAIEESCDDQAAAVCDDPVGYLEGLIDAARGSRYADAASIPALSRSHLLARTQRFLGCRDIEIDSRGLFWALMFLLSLLVFSWTCELRLLSADESVRGRVVAFAQPAGTDHYQIELAREERGPPSPVRH